MSSSTRTVPASPGFRRVRRLRPTTPMERARLWLLLILAVLTIGAWALTIYQARTMDMPMGIVARGGSEPDMSSDPMAGMAMDEPDASGLETTATAGMAGMVAEGWTWDRFVTFFVAWAVMMAAMMFPAAAPMLLLFHAVSSQRRARNAAFLPTWVFAAGYLLVWIGIGAVAWVLVEAGSEVALRLSDTARET